ncbi:MAG: sodium:calcium antiporter, partial [Verrucomicrobiae bacterium]|nr:sodium:calcium antiporter [Verrucomicrobiae bacterium]
MLSDFLFILLALGMLVAGAEALVRGSASLALRLGLTPLTIGLTVVAFGTSSPELVVSLKAAFAGQGDISIGNVVGSNIFNIGAILGITALICPIAVQWQLIKIDGPIMVAVSVLAYLLLKDGSLSRAEGGLLVIGIIAYTAMNARLARQKTSEAVIEEFEEGIPSPTG